MACSLALIWCAKSAQGVLISKSSTADVLNAHSSVLVINNYHITNSNIAYRHPQVKNMYIYGVMYHIIHHEMFF